jgi:hypothetical protein
MENIPTLFVLFVLTGCLLAVVTIWSRRNTYLRVFAVLVLIVFAGLNYKALISLLGHPQPMRFSAIEDVENDSTVLAASIDEGLGIYLWLRHPDVREPRYYRMEWDQKAAIALKKAMDQSMRNNSTVMMSPNYEQSLETNREPLFYILPQDRLPLKPPPEVFEYRNPQNPI